MYSKCSLLIWATACLPELSSHGDAIILCTVQQMQLFRAERDCSMRFFAISFFHESTPNRPLMNVKKKFYIFSTNLWKYSYMEFDFLRIIRRKPKNCPQLSYILHFFVQIQGSTDYPWLKFRLKLASQLGWSYLNCYWTRC